MKSWLRSAFRITVLAIILIAVPGLKHSAHACGETSTEIDYYNDRIPCAPEGGCTGLSVLVGQQIWACDGTYSSWGRVSSISSTHSDSCVECGPQ
jgi:hypothetical protein